MCNYMSAYEDAERAVLKRLSCLVKRRALVRGDDREYVSLCLCERALWLCLEDVEL
jgi:hypothetical protein